MTGPAIGVLDMLLKQFGLAASAVMALTISGTAEARNQMRAVGSSTVYPFAKQVAEHIARANPSLGTPIIESTGTGAGMKLFCAGVGERFPDVENASRRMKASEAKLCAQNGVTAITEIQVGIDGISFATAKGSRGRHGNKKSESPHCPTPIFVSPDEQD